MTKKTIAQLTRTILTGSLIFYILSGITSLLNYVYYPVVARLASTEVFGEIQFLNSLFMQLSVGFIVLNILSIIITGRYVGARRHSILRSLHTIATSVILIIIVVGGLLLSTNRTAFGFESIFPILALGFSLLINVPFTITMGRLQGEGRFMLSGIVGVLGSLFKLVGSVIFLTIGFGTTGAIAGMGIGMLITLALTRYFEQRATSLSSAIQYVSSSPRSIVASYKKQITHFKEEWPLFLIALGGMGVLTCLSSIDVFIAKSILTPYDAGQYAAIATVTKTILYATTPLMWLVLPFALTDLPHTQQKVRLYIAITAAIGVALGTFFSFFPGWIVGTLLGISAVEFIHLLPISSIAMAIFSVSFIVVAIDICRSRLKTTFSVTLAALVSFGVTFSLAADNGMIFAAIIGQIVTAITAIIISVIGNRIFYAKKY